MIGDHISEGSGILFYGDADPYADYRMIEQAVADKKLESRRIVGGNHSLETGNVFADIENLKIMMQLTAGYIGV